MEKWINPETFLENWDVIVIEKIESANPQSPEEFVAAYYQNFVDADILNTFVKAKKAELREKQKAEEAAIEEATQKSVDQNKTEAKVS